MCSDMPAKFPIICGVCGGESEFGDGTLVIKDGETVVEIIGPCHVERWLDALLEVGKKLTPTGVSALCRMRGL